MISAVLATLGAAIVIAVLVLGTVFVWGAVGAARVMDKKGEE